MFRYTQSHYIQHIQQEKPEKKLASISLRDLLDDNCAGNLTEYLSLSVIRMDGDTRISFTTTDSEPVTYSATIPSLTNIDLQSLVFVVQSDKHGVN